VEVMMELPTSFVCPACGYPDLEGPAYSPRTGLGSYDICPSCGFEYGVTDDDRGFSHAAWRCLWVEAGMPWRGVHEPPPGWDPVAQLRTVAP
jgi:hypothetical protein